ncbi:MAG TPA: HYR domain-containing protein [Gemmatimonadaceae bacterium]
MRRSTGLSGYFRLLRAGSAVAISLAVILSCFDKTTAPSSSLTELSPFEIQFPVPDSLKHPAGATVMNGASLNVSSNVIFAPAAPSMAAAMDPGYTVSSVAFAPEPAPQDSLGPKSDDGTIVDRPIGFTFAFYGNDYTKLNIGSNGWVGFGTARSNGCCQGGFIPNSNDLMNNEIAIAWTDWDPGVSAPGSIRYATTGTAPNRKFVLQYSNVRESGINKGLDTGKVTTQLVLSEGSNDITIYTTSLWVDRSDHIWTQGIENADGTLAVYVPGRVRTFSRLKNDAVRFSLPRANQPPVVVAPPNIEVLTSPPSIAGDTRIALALNMGVGTCATIVNPGTASATDDADGVTVVGTRNDGAALDAPYPKGVTTITWTATDAGGLTATSTQTVTVDDKENPLVTPAANISARTDHGASTATVIVVEAVALDNCPNVTVSGARSDNLPLLTGYPIGVTTITWTATDASGNTGSAAQTVTVVGNAAPVITAPASLSFKTDPGVCYAVVNPGTASATDDAEGTTVSGVRNDGGPLNGAYPKGVTTIMWTATDAEGLGASATQTVTVADKQNPSVTPPSNISVGNSHGLATASVSVGSATAEDNCHEVSVSGARNDGGALGALYPVGVTTIKWTATDPSGNSASATQTITVADNEAPTIIVPADIAVNATSSSGAVVTFAVTAGDNVGVTSVSCDHNSGSVFPIGYTSITCVASDAAGHTTSATFGVDVAGAAEQLANLVKDVLSFGLMNGTSNPLINQLRSISGTDPQSCKKLNDFVSMVIKKGRDIPPEESAYLLTEAKRIANVMGCSL